MHAQHQILEGHRCASKEEFTEVLQQWFLEAMEPTVGDVGTYGRRAWLWVTLAGHEIHLNADTKRNAVRRYLDLVRTHGAHMPWHVRPNRNGILNKVCVEPDGTETPGFYLYLRQPVEQQTTI